MTISTEQVYDCLIDHCEEQIIDSMREGREVFTISYDNFVMWMMHDTRCCELTAKNKWKMLQADGVIFTFGHKNKQAHVVVDVLVDVSHFPEKNKNKKIKIFQTDIQEVA